MNGMDDRPIAVIAEHLEGRLTPGTRDAVALALRLGEGTGKNPRILLAAEQVEDLGRELIETFGQDVHVVEVPGLRHYHGEALTIVLGEILHGWSPSFVCLAHSSQGWDLAPRLAFRLGAACITAVEGTSREGGDAVFRRSLHGGKIVADVRPSTATVVLTAQPGAFKTGEGAAQRTGRVTVLKRPYPPCRSRSMGLRPGAPRDAALAQAEVVVAAGRGIGKQENLALVQRLASVFANASVGASRPICDQGWMPYKHQVGLTGATVAPRLYIACGISGAYQHVVGMRDAGFIVAVNTDPHAAIFNIADVCIQEDLTVFIPAFLKALSVG